MGKKRRKNKKSSQNKTGYKKNTENTVDVLLDDGTDPTLQSDQSSNPTSLNKNTHHIPESFQNSLDETKDTILTGGLSPETGISTSKNSATIDEVSPLNQISTTHLLDSILQKSSPLRNIPLNFENMNHTASPLSHADPNYHPEGKMIHQSSQYFPLSNTSVYGQSLQIPESERIYGAYQADLVQEGLENIFIPGSYQDTLVPFFVKIWQMYGAAAKSKKSFEHKLLYLEMKSRICRELFGFHSMDTHFATIRTKLESYSKFNVKQHLVFSIEDLRHRCFLQKFQNPIVIDSSKSGPIFILDLATRQLHQKKALTLKRFQYTSLTDLLAIWHKLLQVRELFQFFQTVLDAAMNVHFSQSYSLLSPEIMAYNIWFNPAEFSHESPESNNNENNTSRYFCPHIVGLQINPKILHPPHTPKTYNSCTKCGVGGKNLIKTAEEELFNLIEDTPKKKKKKKKNKKKNKTSSTVVTTLQTPKEPASVLGPLEKDQLVWLHLESGQTFCGDPTNYVENNWKSISPEQIQNWIFPKTLSNLSKKKKSKNRNKISKDTNPVPLENKFPQFVQSHLSEGLSKFWKKKKKTKGPNSASAPHILDHCLSFYESSTPLYSMVRNREYWAHQHSKKNPNLLDSQEFIRKFFHNLLPKVNPLFMNIENGECWCQQCKRYISLSSFNRFSTALMWRPPQHIVLSILPTYYKIASPAKLNVFKVPDNTPKEYHFYLEALFHFSSKIDEKVKSLIQILGGKNLDSDSNENINNKDPICNTPDLDNLIAEYSKQFPPSIIAIIIGYIQRNPYFSISNDSDQPPVTNQFVSEMSSSSSPANSQILESYQNLLSTYSIFSEYSKKHIISLNHEIQNVDVDQILHSPSANSESTLKDVFFPTHKTDALLFNFGQRIQQPQLIQDMTKFGTYLVHKNPILIDKKYLNDIPKFDIPRSEIIRYLNLLFDAFEIKSISSLHIKEHHISFSDYPDFPLLGTKLLFLKLLFSHLGIKSDPSLIEKQQEIEKQEREMARKILKNQTKKSGKGKNSSKKSKSGGKSSHPRGDPSFEKFTLSSSNATLFPVPMGREQLKFIDIPAILDQKTSPIRGMRNLGNSCFFNSTIQAITGLQPFKDEFIQIIDPLTIPKKIYNSFQGEFDSYSDSLTLYLQTTSKNIENYPISQYPRIYAEGRLTSSFRTAISLLYHPDYSDIPLDPHHLFTCVRKMNPMFSGFRQHDAHEFLRFFVDSMESELLKTHKKLTEFFLKQAKTVVPPSTDTETEMEDDSVPVLSDTVSENDSPSSSLSFPSLNDSINNDSNGTDTDLEIEESDLESSNENLQTDDPSSTSTTDTDTFDDDPEDHIIPPRPNFKMGTICDTFVGVFKSVIMCRSCGSISTSLEPFSDMSLPMPTGFETSKSAKSNIKTTKTEIQIKLRAQIALEAEKMKPVQKEMRHLHKQRLSLSNLSDDPRYSLENQSNSPTDFQDCLVQDPQYGIYNSLYRLCNVDLLKGDNAYACLNCSKYYATMLLNPPEEENLTRYENHLVKIAAALEQENSSSNASSSSSSTNDYLIIKSPAFKVVSVVEWPETLVIHLNRFKRVRNGRMRENSNHVEFDFDFDTIKFNGPKYELESIVVHRGTMSGGHYVCYKRKKVRNDYSWWYISDGQVSQVTQDTVAKQQAYLLFYSKTTQRTLKT